MNKTSLIQKVSLVLGGLLLGVFLLEIGLRLAGFVLLSVRDRENQQRLRERSEVRILCVGESTTYGIGQNSYPSQLEIILNKKSGGRKFTVVNKGKPGCNTAYILKKLEWGWADKYQPDIVMTMMGINDGAGNNPIIYFPEEETGKIKLFIGNLRVCKFAKLLGQNILYKLSQAGSSSAPRPEPALPGRFADAVVRNDIVREEAELVARIEDGPENAPVYVDLGKCYLEQDKFEEAAEAFSRALELDPGNAPAQVGLARYLLHKQSYTSAVKSCRKALELDPVNASAWLVLGLIFLDNHQLPDEGAAANLEKCLEIDPSNDEALSALGWCYWKEKRFDEARGVAGRALEINPLNDWAYGVLWNCFKSEGDYPKAIEVCLRAVDADPNNYGAYAELGYLYQSLDNPERAKEYLDKARSLRMSTYNPDTVRNYNRLKELLRGRGIQMVCVQYPLRDVKPLKKMLEPHEGVIFVDNEEVFREALRERDYYDLFTDNFGGDFGHCSLEGNRLLAGNIADVLLREYFKENSGDSIRK